MITSNIRLFELYPLKTRELLTSAQEVIPKDPESLAKFQEKCDPEFIENILENLTSSTYEEMEKEVDYLEEELESLTEALEDREDEKYALVKENNLLAQKVDDYQVKVDVLLADLKALNSVNLELITQNILLRNQTTPDLSLKLELPHLSLESTEAAISEAIDVIYDFSESCIAAGNFPALSLALESISIHSLPVEVLLAPLTYTVNVSSLLPTRSLYFDRVAGELVRRQRVDLLALLKGLAN